MSYAVARSVWTELCLLHQLLIGLPGALPKYVTPLKPKTFSKGTKKVKCRIRLPVLKCEHKSLKFSTFCAATRNFDFTASAFRAVLLSALWSRKGSEKIRISLIFTFCRTECRAHDLIDSSCPWHWLALLFFRVWNGSCANCREGQLISWSTLPHPLSSSLLGRLKRCSTPFLMFGCWSSSVIRWRGWYQTMSTAASKVSWNGVLLGRAAERGPALHMFVSQWPCRHRCCLHCELHSPCTAGNPKTKLEKIPQTLPSQHVWTTTQEAHLPRDVFWPSACPSVSLRCRVFVQNF